MNGEILEIKKSFAKSNGEILEIKKSFAKSNGEIFEIKKSFKKSNGEILEIKKSFKKSNGEILEIKKSFEKSNGQDKNQNIIILVILLEHRIRHQINRKCFVSSSHYSPFSWNDITSKKPEVNSLCLQVIT